MLDGSPAQAERRHRLEAAGPPRGRARGHRLSPPWSTGSGCTAVVLGLAYWPGDDVLAYGLGGAAGAWLLLDGVLALASGRRGALDLSPWVPLLLGLSVFIVMAVGLGHLARRKDVPVLDPLTGVDMTAPLPRWVLPVMIAPPVLALVLAVVIGLAER